MIYSSFISSFLQVIIYSDGIKSPARATCCKVSFPDLIGSNVKFTQPQKRRRRSELQFLSVQFTKVYYSVRTEQTNLSVCTSSLLIPGSFLFFSVTRCLMLSFNPCFFSKSSHLFSSIFHMHSGLLKMHLLVFFFDFQPDVQYVDKYLSCIGV